MLTTDFRRLHFACW